MDLPPHTFEELRSLIHRLCGLVIPEEKTYLIRHRLEPVARSHGCRSFEEFSQKLRGPEAALLHDSIITAITTNETSFFRDKHPFETFRQEILPRLGEAVRRRKQQLLPRDARTRIWCAAASTGQEPYSLAMILQDYITLNRPLGITDGDFEILATDISAKVLATALAGEYTGRELARGLTPQQINRFFRKQGTKFVVDDRLRSLIVFRRVNLVQPFLGLGTFDLIFCRNALIYFDDATKRRICGQFFDMLPAGGLLFLGSAENLYGISDRFESLHYGETLVYRKIAGTVP